MTYARNRRHKDRAIVNRVRADLPLTPGQLKRWEVIAMEALKQTERRRVVPDREAVARLKRRIKELGS